MGEKLVKLLRKFAASVLAAGLIVSGISAPASANIQNLQESAEDEFTRDDTPSNFDITSVAYAEFTDNPDFHYFFLNFDSYVEADQFDDDLGSWAMIRIDIDGDDKEDYRIETTVATLEENFTSPAEVWDSRLNKSVSGCSGGFYSNIEEQVSWIGFRISYNCLKLPKTFGIQGYSDFIEEDEEGFDYAPDDGFFKVTHKLVPPAVIENLEAPGIASETLYTVATPGSPPVDLVQLSPQVLKSVVTVFCGQGLGTGWAARVALPQSVTQRGMKTFLITNHHVVEECLGTGEVTLSDGAGNVAVGKIASADEKNDLAGIYTTMELPTLVFRGERPQQGWWVGVLGSPRGLEGYLTTGIVSKVTQDGSEFGVSASLNPGNSGGPIFDREGRVLGVATYKFLDSEGLGFARSTPLMCQLVVKCAQANSIWLTNLSARPGTGVVTPEPPVVVPEPVVPAKIKSAVLPAFAAKSAKLSITQQNSINRQLVLNDWVKKFICTGVISATATTAERTLARTRAKAACDFALKRNPSLATFFQTKVSASKTSIGKVLITLKN